MKKQIFSALFTAALWGSPLLSGCASKVESVPTLANQGILALSPENPFLGSNLFVAKEAERSPVFYNFLRDRGAPSAIKLSERTFKNSTANMYYPAEAEMYIAELVEEGEHHDWIVRGPFAIPRREFQEIMRIGASVRGEPPLLIAGKRVRFREPPIDRKLKPVEPSVPYIIPTPEPTRAPKPKIIKKASSAETPAPTPAAVPPVAEWKNLNSDQRAILLSQGYAERDDNNNVIHTVKSPSETFEAIAQWYTGSAANAETIAKENGISPGKELLAGMRVTVPAALVKQQKAMGSH